jgi:hypothetical protein
VSPRARTTVRWLAWIGGIALVVLLASGVYVTFRYRPDATGTALAMVRLHRWSSYVVALAAIGVLLLAAPWRTLRAWIPVVVFLVALVVALVSGARLVWDQVGLFAVTTGREVRGMFFLHHPAVFVRVNGHEYSWEGFRDLFWLHSVLVPMAMAVAFAWAMLLARRSQVSPT